MANTNLNTVYSSAYDNLATIGRRSNTYHRWTGRMFDREREAYPSNFAIQQNARQPASRFESIGHLSKADQIWTAAIAADVSLNHRSERQEAHRDPFLEDLMEVGLYDRMQGDTRDSAEETSMRYTAAMSSAVMDHVDKLESRVSF
jgi:hypothetical protein